ncbi:MAG: hypothetical protein LBU15_02650 [Rickettsiales bacterium]|jgi:serine/threonine protein kinase|nr:hypothetical protein [Rickettsiales bacterium]
MADDDKHFIEETIRQILMFGCNNSFGEGENISVSCNIVGAPIMGGPHYERSPLFYRKEEKGLTSDIIKRPWKEAIVISSDDFSVKFQIFSRKLGGNVVVKISHFSIMDGIMRGVWDNGILYYKSVWEELPSSELVPLELRNLEQVFDYGDIYSLPPGILAGYPEDYPEEITDWSCGVGVTVSEDLSLGRPLGSMGREEARSALLANDNIYGLIRALWAVQNPRQPSGINCPHLLIHGNINPNNLVVVGAGNDPIVKICNWDMAIAVPPKNSKNPFIFELSELPKGRKVDIFGKEGGGIGAGTMTYTAPELLHDKGTDTRKIDMFSLAMVLLEMLTLKGPWYDDPWVQQNLEGVPEFKLMMLAETEEGREQWMNEFISPNLKEAVKMGLDPDIARIIESGCNLDPEMRLAPEEISTKSAEDAKSVLNKVVKASNAINGKGPGAPGGGPGGLGGGPGGPGGLAPGDFKKT